MTTPMTRTRSIWTDDRIKALRADVNALVAKGSTKAAAFTKLAPKYKCSHYHVSRMYRYDHATIRQWARSKSANNTARITRSNTTSTPANTAVTMTPAEAIQFYNFLKSANITIA